MICHLINNLCVETKTICLAILGDPMSSQDIDFKLHYMFTKHTFISIIYCINNILTLIFLITGIVLLIIELVKFKKRANLPKGKFEVKSIKKLTIYFSAPITIIAFAIMLVQTVISAI